MGVKSTGGSTFVTSAPELPSMILRDPPGSNSFASITKGTTFSFDTSISNTGNSTVAAGVGVSMGADLQFGVGLGFVKNTTVDITADVNTGISTSITKGVDNTSSFSMTFEETISTSDDPNFVGADGDLYIGNSKNGKFLFTLIISYVSHNIYLVSFSFLYSS